MFRDVVRDISRELIAVQTPIRVLDAVKWNAGIEAHFLKTKTLRLKEHYAPLTFNPKSKQEELKSLRSQIARRVGEADGLGPLLTDVVEGYAVTVRMLEARGSRLCGELSAELWGRAQAPFLTSGLSLSQYCDDFHKMLSGVGRIRHLQPKELSASEVVQSLRERFARFPFLAQIEVKETDGIVADAAAGGSVLKIRSDALFSLKDLDILEVHEAHTHIATSLNGRTQTYAQWLGYGPPRSTATQEGLAVLMEALTLCTYPKRVQKLNDRVRAIALAESGADAVEVYQFLLEEGYPEKEAYRMMMRIFRGTLGEGGAPFSKDLSYMKGFIECYNLVSACLTQFKPDAIHFLFAGKLKLEDVPVLIHHAQTGLVEKPSWLPPVFASLEELASWFIFPAQLGQLQDADLQHRYRSQIA